MLESLPRNPFPPLYSCQNSPPAAGLSSTAPLLAVSACPSPVLSTRDTYHSLLSSTMYVPGSPTHGGLTKGRERALVTPDLPRRGSQQVSINMHFYNYVVVERTKDLKRKDLFVNSSSLTKEPMTLV